MGLIQCEEADVVIQSIADPIARNFVNMIYTIAFRRCYFDKTDMPKGDFDMCFLVRVLEEFFIDKETIVRTLNGERVGEFFEE